MVVIATHASALGRLPRKLGKNQWDVKNELFVDTINNLVFMRKPFIIWKPPLVKDARGSLVRRGHQSRPSHRASSGLSEAPENRHIYLFLFEDKLRIICGGKESHQEH